MNCKPGDLAMVMDSVYPHLLGRVITVHNLIGKNEYGPVWSYSGHLTDANGDSLVCVEDCALRPIRDPGDDAVDEMVQLVGEATARTA